MIRSEGEVHEFESGGAIQYELGLEFLAGHIPRRGRGVADGVVLDQFDHGLPVLGPLGGRGDFLAVGQEQGIGEIGLDGEVIGHREGGGIGGKELAGAGGQAQAGQAGTEPGKGAVVHGVRMKQVGMRVNVGPAGGGDGRQKVLET